MAKKSEYKKLKDKAWTLFSKYLRMKYSDANGYCECYTCGDRKHYKELQAGHLLDGRANSILFEWSGVKPQCKKCNLFLSGNKENYIPKFIREHGEEEFSRLKRLKSTTGKFSNSDLEDKIALYKEKIKELEKGE